MTDATKLAIDFLHCVDQRFDLAKEPHAPGVTMLDQFHAALAALRAKPAGWMPIETAPKERTPMIVVLGILTSGYVTDPWCVWWQEDAWQRWPHKEAPTHWMPLPPPPGQGRAQPDHSELVKRLRNFDFGSSDVDQWIEIMDEAADALEGKAIGETME